MADGQLEHRLTVRAHHLAEAITHRKELLVSLLKPAGSMLPFDEQLTTEEAFVFWSKHRYDEIGKPVLATYTPQRIAELDNWLMQEVAKREQPVGLV